MSLQKVPAWTQAGTFLCAGAAPMVIRRAVSLQKYANPLAIHTIRGYNRKRRGNKRQGRECYQHPLPLCRRRDLPHSIKMRHPHYTHFPLFFQGGGASYWGLCVLRCRGNPCAAFYYPGGERPRGRGPSPRPLPGRPAEKTTHRRKRV